MGREKVITVLSDVKSTSKKKSATIEYIVNYKRMPFVKVGDTVDAGTDLVMIEAS